MHIKLILVLVAVVFSTGEGLGYVAIVASFLCMYLAVLRHISNLET